MEKLYHVYGLACPHDHNVFYIGMSINPKNRLSAHMTDPGCAPYRYCRELKAQGLKPKMVFFGCFPDKYAARVLEARLILAIPNLYNSTVNCLPPRESGWVNLDAAFY